MAKVLGIGGVFIRCKHPHALAHWYEKWLGMPMDSDFAALFKPQQMPKEAFSLWATFRRDTTYFPDEQAVMLNFVVDDLEASLKQVQSGGAQVFDERRAEDFGVFGWFIDPEGNKVELWQPSNKRNNE